MNYRINGLAPICTIRNGCMNIQRDLLVINAIMFTSSKEVTESAEPTLVCFVMHPLGIPLNYLRSLSTIGRTRFSRFTRLGLEVSLAPGESYWPSYTYDLSIVFPELDSTEVRDLAHCSEIS
jgi:hypothetical protein